MYKEVYTKYIQKYTVAEHKDPLHSDICFNVKSYSHNHIVISLKLSLINNLQKKY